MDSSLKVSSHISVVMSVFNGEHFIADAIDSILDQTYSKFEFIIIDDGSSDNSLSIIKAYQKLDSRIIIHSQSNSGLSKALNLGISLANTNYIARMDADDIAANDRLERQYKFLQENPEYVVVGSSANIIDNEGNHLYISYRPTLDEELKGNLPNNPFFHSSTMFCKTAFYKTGGYNENILHHFEDKLLWNQMAQYGKFYNFYEPLINYRITPNSLTNYSISRYSKLQSIFLKVLNHKEILISEKKTLFMKQDDIKNKRSSLFNYNLRLAKIYLEKCNDKPNAFRKFIKALKYNPLSHIVYFNLFLLCFPMTVIKYWKQLRYMYINKHN